MESLQTLICLQNLGLSVIPLLVGWLKDHTGTYASVELLFCGFAVTGCALGVLQNLVDYREGSPLNRPGGKIPVEIEDNHLDHLLYDETDVPVVKSMSEIDRIQ